MQASSNSTHKVRLNNFSVPFYARWAPSTQGRFIGAPG